MAWGQFSLAGEKPKIVPSSHRSSLFPKPFIYREKGLPGPLETGSKKPEKKSEKESKMSRKPKKKLKTSRAFLDPGGRRPREPLPQEPLFRLFFWVLQGEAFLTPPPVSGGSKMSGVQGSKIYVLWSDNTASKGTVPYFCSEWDSAGMATLTLVALQHISETPKCGSGRMWELGAQGGSAKAPERNNAPGGSTARATRAWRKHALQSSETL